MSGDCIEGGIDVWRLYRGRGRCLETIEGGVDVWRLHRGRG